MFVEEQRPNSPIYTYLYSLPQPCRVDADAAAASNVRHTKASS